MPLGFRPPSYLPHATQPSRKEVERPCWFSAQLNSGKPCVVNSSHHGTIPLIVLGLLPLFYFVETDGILLLYKDVQKLCI